MLSTDGEVCFFCSGANVACLGQVHTGLCWWGGGVGRFCFLEGESDGCVVDGGNVANEVFACTATEGFC